MRLKSLITSVAIVSALTTCFSATSVAISAVPAEAHGHASSIGCWKLWPSEKSFAVKTNRARSHNGVAKLHLDPQLSRVAKLHAAEMANKDVLYHTSTSDLMHRVTGWSSLGENVGVDGGVRDYGSLTTVTALQRAFMHSPDHRANILLPSYRYMGVGVARHDNKMWVTVIFESSQDPGTTLRMPGSC
ncbi:MAG: CAP domain-containing protein [Actinomycetota bacterium]|nr:CAP domain-containing protein [Actinomycetota bacterium]